MVGFVQNTGVDIQTTLPNTTPVGTQSESIGPQVVETLANAGASIYRTSLLTEAQEGAQEVLQQFNSDLQAAEDAGTLNAFTDSQLTAIANESPEYKGVVQELRRINQATQQGTAPRLLLQLRAEAALKRTINRAPGLRSEITRAARDVLNFDPSGALINALLNSDDSDASAQAKSIQWENRQNFQYLQENNLPALSLQDPDSFQTNRERVERHKAVIAQQDQIKENSEQQAITEGNSIAAFEQTITEGLSLQFDDLTIGVRNVLGSIRTTEQLRAAKPELRSQLAQLQQSANTYIDNEFNQLRTTGPGAKLAQEARERAKQNALGGISLLLEQDDFTVVEQNVALLEFMQQDLKMNFVDANASLAYVQQNMPGWIQNVYPTILARDLGTEQRISQLVNSAVNYDPNFIRQIDMRNQLASLVDVRAFEGLSRDERRSVATKNYALLEEAVRNVDEATSSPDAVDRIGNAYATVAQTLDPSNTEDSRRAVNLLASPAFSKLADSMVSGRNGNVTSEIVADSAIASMTNYIRNAGLPDVAGSRFATDVTYDYSTGSFTITDIQQPGPSATPSAAGILAGEGAGVTGAARRARPRRDAETVRTLNRALEGIYNLRSHDPSIANLSRAEVAQFIVGGRLGNVNTVGAPQELQLPVQSSQRQQRIDFNQTVRSTSQAIANTIAGLDSNTELASQLQQLQSDIEQLSTTTPQ